MNTRSTLRGGSFRGKGRLRPWNRFTESSNSELSTEWAILELQGDLKSHSDSNFEGQFIGDLQFTKSGIPLLIIGHHLIYGKEAKIEKPFALIEKQENNGKSEFVVKSIVKNKIIFKTRPKPIVAKTENNMK